MNEGCFPDQSLHAESNDNGTCVVDFAANFEHKRVHKAMWKSPYSAGVNQIDILREGTFQRKSCTILRVGDEDHAGRVLR